MQKQKQQHSSPPARWWVGGAASSMACIFTHPLDTLKVRLQNSTASASSVISSKSAASTLPASTASVTLSVPSQPVAAPASAPSSASSARPSLVRTVATIVRTEGVLAFYRGLSASLLRQATYSTARFAVYEDLKARKCSTLTASIVGGAVGGVIGSPADLVNVRMQSGNKKGYRNAFVGLVRIVGEEGALGMFRGIGPNVARAVLMTSGQLASYDLFKAWILDSGVVSGDGVGVHLTASMLAGVVATTICSPVDVIKTRVMASSKGPPPSMLVMAMTILKNEGPIAFLKGWVPAFARLGPHTILTFVFFEQLKKLSK